MLLLLLMEYYFSVKGICNQSFTIISTSSH